MSVGVSSEFVRRARRIHWLIFTVTLGFASVVEWSHVRRMIRLRDPRVVTTAMAAISAGYMASEALERSWPTWRYNGYDD